MWKHYKKWYFQSEKEIFDLRKELENFKAEVYEKEVVKVLQEKINSLEKELIGVTSKNEVYFDCNRTLTQALNNLTSKSFKE